MAHEAAPQAVTPSGRLPSLDAVRGLASLAVVLSHCYLLLPEAQRGSLDASMAGRLLLPFYNGNAAVVIFFILSGYVLSLPYLNGRPPAYLRFVVRRLCRIYLPFAASIAAAILLYAAASHAPAPGASQWFNELVEVAPPTLAIIAAHLLMVGTSHAMALNPVMWSLVYELRVSLALPVLMRLCRSTPLAIVAGLVLLLTPTKLLNAVWADSHPSFAATIWPTLFWTLNIAAYFITGILLSKHRLLIASKWARLPGVLRPALFAVPYAIFCITPTFSSAKVNGLYDAGAAVLVVLAVESPGLRRLLDQRLPQWLGRISYSLYLIHLPLMLAIVPMLIGRMPFPALAAILVAASLAAGAVMHALVEQPAMRLGHRLTRNTRRQTPQMAGS